LSPPMKAYEAWSVLGKDPARVFSRLASLPRSGRAAAAAEDLSEARRIAKSLMAVHHPDRGGDPKEFRRVNDAIISLESYMEEFSRRLAEADEKDAVRRESRPVFIKLGGD